MRKKRLGLTSWILIAIAAGVVFGAVAPGGVPYVAWMGEVFKQALKMLIAPLVMASMVTGMAALGDVRRLGRLGGVTIGFYALTTFLAVSLGLVLVNLIRPGDLAGHLTEQDRALVERVDAAVGQGACGRDEVASALERVASELRWTPPEGSTFDSLARSVVAALGEGKGLAPSLERVVSTARLRERVGVGPEPKAARMTIGQFLEHQIQVVFVNPFKALAGMNVLGIIVFSLAFGGVLTTMGDKGKVALDFFESVNLAMLKLVDLVMLMAPPGVFALMAKEVAASGLGILGMLLAYMATVLLGLAIHAGVSLHLILRFVGGRGFLGFLRDIRDAVMVAFSTSSSSATLGVSLDCAENRLHVRREVCGFVLPLGATVNMDGTALYESVAALFIAQVYGIDLTVGQQIVVFLTATLASIGAAGIPSAGTVTMVMVLTAVGLPLEGIGLILAVDRVLDMCRTAVNVIGDLTGTVVVERLAGEGGGR